MRRAVADPVQTHARRVHWAPPAVVVNVVIIGEMPRRRKRFPISAVERHTACAALRDIATHYPMVRSAGDADRRVAEITQRAAENPVARPPSHGDRGLARSLENQ